MKARIRKTVIGVNRNSSERLVHELGREAIIHLGGWDLRADQAPTGMYADLERSAGAVIQKIDSLCAQMGIAAAPGETAGAVSAVFERDFAGDEASLDSLRSEIDTMRELRHRCDAESESLRTRIEEAREASWLAEAAAYAAGMKMCVHMFGVITGKIAAPEPDRAAAFYVSQAGRYVIGISLPADRQAMADFLEGHGYEDREDMLVRLVSSPGFLDEQRGNLESMRRELETKEAALNERVDEITARLFGLREIYAELVCSIEATKSFLHTADTRFISGWIDLDDADRLVSVLRRVCEKDFFIHVFSEQEMRDAGVSVPVRLRNLWFFRAFEMIVRNAGMPGSTELDPTPVAAIAYLLMFGVMFGDIGQGLVLSLSGLAMKFIARKRKLKAFFHDGGTILIAAGLSAALFGVLYGSVFSCEDLVPALWFHPMTHIMDLFFAAIMMGASFIALGLVMNIVNLVKRRDFFEAIFGRLGMLGFIVYAGSFFLAVRYIEQGTAPGMTGLLLVVALPVGVFLLRNIPEHFFFGRQKLFPHGIFEYVIESFVELMEMFSGFLGNSISFIRAGAFALSHAGLSVAVYTLAGIAGPILSAGALSIIVTGNVFIILLEGLVCGIQSMRLEYYEFFSKFFRGDGIEFRPFAFGFRTREKHVAAREVAG